MNEARDRSDGTISEARLRIAQLRVDAGASLSQVCAHVAKISAHTLGVARVGVWIFSEDRATLHCAHLLAPSSSEPPVMTLETRFFPEYIRALDTHRWVCADDAVNDPSTRELAAGYLIPLGISSMLDAPIFRGKELYGIVCHEHVGPPRHWTAEDRAFAGSVGDILALVVEQGARLSAEEALARQEEEMRVAQKMEALGRMAAGVAHDVNNLLSAIDALATVIERHAGAETVREPAHDIREVTSRGVRLMRQLLGFSRPAPCMPRRLDLGGTVLELQPLLRTLAQARVALDAPHEMVWVNADPSQIEQIVINLALNGRDAMPHGGDLLVEVTAAAGEAAIVVRDEGVGMSPATRAHIFEPYFTTKEGGKGTGLGLATVWGIVRSLGGRVEVETAPGEGSTFRVVLPALG